MQVEGLKLKSQSRDRYVTSRNAALLHPKQEKYEYARYSRLEWVGTVNACPKHTSDPPARCARTNDFSSWFCFVLPGSEFGECGLVHASSHDRGDEDTIAGRCPCASVLGWDYGWLVIHLNLIFNFARSRDGKMRRRRRGACKLNVWRCSHSRRWRRSVCYTIYILFRFRCNCVFKFISVAKLRWNRLWPVSSWLVL